MTEETKELLQYKQNFWNDNIQYKEIIKKKLLNNHKILVALDSPDLDPDEQPDAYIGTHILGHYVLPEVKTQAVNMICYETSFTEQPKYNQVMKYGQIIFYILCDPKNIIDRSTGIERHDLISALLTTQFNWSNDFGAQIHLVSDRPYAVDSNKYVLRTLVFEQISPNTTTKNGKMMNYVR